MNNIPQWGPWTPWCPYSAYGPPPDAPPGTLLQADLKIRPNLIGKCKHPFYVIGHIFVVR